MTGWLGEELPSLSERRERAWRAAVPAFVARACVEAAAKAFEVAPAFIWRRRSRKRDTVRARYAAIYAVRSLTNATLKPIGFALGRRDHTTILDALRRHEALMERDEGHRRRTEQALDLARAAIGDGFAPAAKPPSVRPRHKAAVDIAPGDAPASAVDPFENVSFDDVGGVRPSDSRKTLPRGGAR